MGVHERDPAARLARGPEWAVAVGRDPVFGPVVRFGRAGPGGLAGAPVVALPPLNTAIIRTLVRGSRQAGEFTAEGGMGAEDLAAFERLLWTVSATVSELPELRELELGPLLVKGGEVYASGARAAVAPRPPGAGRYDHMAVHPWPSDLQDRWTLPDGTVVLVRPIRPEDAEMEAGFVRGLSGDTRHLRFMTAMKELTREQLIRFTQLDYGRELALVALVERGGQAREIAVARYAMVDRESAHVALVVADEWQGKGIGGRLLGRVVDAARARGLARLEGELLADNLPIQRLLARMGFTFRRDPDGGDVLLIELRLAPLASAGAGREDARP
jgi:acetyltransferase